MFKIFGEKLFELKKKSNIPRKKTWLILIKTLYRNMNLT